MIFRRVAAHPDGPRKKLSASFLVSVGVHTVVAIALMQMLILDGKFSPRPKRVAADREERVGFVRLPQAGVKIPTAGRSGGDGRPAAPREIRVVAPATIPTALPAPSAPVAKTPDNEGVGPLVGTGGPARGIRPQYSDPRVWAPPGKVVAPPKTVAENRRAIASPRQAPSPPKKRDPSHLENVTKSIG